ncbi:MAG: type II toxin-antitoxin system MqsA family antitoxin [bacterium]
MNRCYCCGSDEMLEKRVDYSFWWGERLIVFREVTASVCTSCGEKYFRPEISTRMKHLTQEIDEGKRKYKEIAVPTIEFADEAMA